jgi:putative addiction module CopG family antidote
MSSTLPPEFNAFIQARVASGAYSSEHDVLQKAFELLEKRESLLAHIDEGRQQLALGRFIEYGENDRDTFIADIARSSSPANPADKSR